MTTAKEEGNIKNGNFVITAPLRQQQHLLTFSSNSSQGQFPFRHLKLYFLSFATNNSTS
jgi:hypothetical protein